MPGSTAACVGTTGTSRPHRPRKPESSDAAPCYAGGFLASLEKLLALLVASGTDIGVNPSGLYNSSDAAERGAMMQKDVLEGKKELTTGQKITKAVEDASRSWPGFAVGDPNLVDIYWLAQKIREGLGVTLPTESPPKSAGVAAFECVETNLLRQASGRGLVRFTPVAEVARLIVNLHGLLRGMLPFTEDQALVVSLFGWHGCMHMGKVLRCFANAPGGVIPYTAQMRRDGYSKIREDWEKNLATGNPWVRYGVSITRLMEQGRKGENFDYEIHENWIPEDSPYWQE